MRPGPILARPESIYQLHQEEVYAKVRIAEIRAAEQTLKAEYSLESARQEKQVLDVRDQIKILNREIKEINSKKNRMQKENRSKRAKLSEERLRLQKDLKGLSSRLSSFRSALREKVKRNPGIALAYFDKEARNES